MAVAFSCIMRAHLTMTNPCVHNLNDIPICILQWWLPTVMSPLPWQPSALTVTRIGSVPRWQRPASTASRVDCIPRWLCPALTASRVDRGPRCAPHPKAGAWRAKRPREISSDQAREKTATFFGKRETWKKHSFFWRLKTLSFVQMYDSHIR